MGKVGRKSLYESNVVPNLDKIKKWIIHKNSDEFIADSLGIGYSTWMKYKAEKQELIELIEDAPKFRASIVEDVWEKQIERAKGFEYEETKTILIPNEDGKPIILKKEIYKKRALPDPTAAKEVLFKLGDKESSSRASFDLKAQEFAFKKAQAQAESEWTVEGVEEDE